MALGKATLPNRLFLTLWRTSTLQLITNKLAVANFLISQRCLIQSTITFFSLNYTIGICGTPFKWLLNIQCVKIDQVESTMQTITVIPMLCINDFAKLH